MAIDPLMSAISHNGPAKLASPTSGVGLGASPTAESQSPSDSFATMLNNAFSALNQQQQTADAAQVALASGAPVEIHDVMLAVEQASIGLQFATQVRNKFIEAYQEVSRMQV